MPCCIYQLPKRLIRQLHLTFHIGPRLWWGISMLWRHLLRPLGNTVNEEELAVSILQTNRQSRLHRVNVENGCRHNNRQASSSELNWIELKMNTMAQARDSTDTVNAVSLGLRLQCAWRVDAMGAMTRVALLCYPSNGQKSFPFSSKYALKVIEIALQELSRASLFYEDGWGQEPDVEAQNRAKTTNSWHWRRPKTSFDSFQLHSLTLK